MNAIILNIILIAGLQTSNSSLFTTHFVGMPKDTLVEVVKEKHRVFKLNTTTINTTYNYLKYEDLINEITVLFFLNKNEECKAIRIMSDYSNINNILSQLNASYKKTDDATWRYGMDRKEYKVTLEEGDWFFTVTIKEKE